MSKRARGSITTTLLILVQFAAPAAGQDEDLEMELFFAPAETVTSAAKHVQPVEQSPSAVTIITREEIEACGARTLPELLRLVLGVDVSMTKPTWYVVGAHGFAC